MKHRPGRWHRVLLFLLVVVLLVQMLTGPVTVWDARLGLLRRTRPHSNPRRNQERWARRHAAWVRQHRRMLESPHRRHRLVQPRLTAAPTAAHAAALTALALGLRHPVSTRPVQLEPAVPPTVSSAPDPLADLRAGRGWIDQLDERRLWAMLIQVRWPHGPQCPRCGETDPRDLKLIAPDYRGGLGRWQCQVCAGAGDPGQAGTFTPLTGTLLDGMRVDVRTLWLIVEALAKGQASLETAQEAQVHRHTTDRLFRLLRAALYQARSTEPIVLGPEDVGECDEVYITAGLKGKAGGLPLDREPRRRGLKRRGRGDWDSDRLPVLGLLCRGGQVRLVVLRNVQSATIRPIVHQMIRRGAKVYTDSYAIYHFLDRDGYHHQTVNHGAGEYALDLDGDGRCEVHCNTMECTWSWLRPMIRTYRGISKVYLPLYVAHFEFLFNRRQENHWNRTLDVLQVALQVDATKVADWVARVEGAEFAEVCPVAG
jgi:transposase-like protein